VSLDVEIGEAHTEMLEAHDEWQRLMGAGLFSAAPAAYARHIARARRYAQLVEAREARADRETAAMLDRQAETSDVDSEDR
jgi:hypothetical protein